MQRVRYRFVPTKPVEVQTAGGKIYVFKTAGGAERCSLRSNEYALASLFNAQRSEEEIRDIVFKTQGLTLSADHLCSFISKLLEVGLLEPVHLPSPTPSRRRSSSAIESESASPDGLSGTSVEESGALAAVDLDQPRSVPPRRSQSTDAHTAQAAASAESVDEARDFADIAGTFIPESDVEEELAATTANNAPGAPAAVSRGGGAPADDAPDSAAATTRQTHRTRLLVRFPVRWLLPLATPLAWASNRYSAFLLGALLLAEGLGLWQSRLELERDLTRWFAPLSVIQTMALGLVFVNLWSQLARAAEFTRRLRTVPAFGLTLAWNVLPVFAVDLSTLARIKDTQTARAIFAASLSAIATICALFYFGWFLTKNNGTSLPLVCLGLAALATTRLLFALNPLARRDGYFLLAFAVGVPDLRRRALMTLRRASTRQPLSRRPVAVPRWALILYGAAIVAYIVAIFVVVTIFVGGWLESHWGGFGVIVYVTLFALVVASPIRDARARRAARVRAIQRYRPRTARQRVRSIAKVAIFLVALAVIAMIPYQYEPGGEFVLRPLQNQRTDVRSLVSGRVDELRVQEGDYVQANQVLARVSGDEERKNVDATAAQIRELQAQLAKAIAGATPEAIAVARQRVASARTRYGFSSSKTVRYAQLHQSGFASPQEYDNVRGEAEVDHEALLQAEKELAELLAGTRQEDIDALRASIDSQKANLQYYQQQQQYIEIRAPIAGRIVSGSLVTASGNYLKQGDLFATIENTSDLLAEISVPQFDIALVAIGAPIRLKTWLHSDVEMKAVVQTVAPSAEETSAGEMVRVIGELDNPDGTLKSGMTGYAKIAGAEMPAALAFTRIVVRFFQIELWSWLP